MSCHITHTHKHRNFQQKVTSNIFKCLHSSEKPSKNKGKANFPQEITEYYRQAKSHWISTLFLPCLLQKVKDEVIFTLTLERSGLK